MRWEDERYVRVYTRDTPEFLALSWQARGLLCLIMRKVDRAGILTVGKLGLRGVAVVVGGAWSEVEGPLRELLDDGCVTFNESDVVLPNFLAAQEAPRSDAARKRESRERALAGSKSQNVTQSHVGSRLVTPSRAVPSRAVPSRAVPPEEIAASAADGPDGPPPFPVVSSPHGSKATLAAPAPQHEAIGNPDARASVAQPATPPNATYGSPGGQHAFALEPPEPSKPSPVDVVFAGYVEGWRTQAKPKAIPPRLTDKRRVEIRKALKEHPPEILALATRGIWLSGWHRDADQVRLDLAIRDADQVEKFSGYATRGSLVPADRGNALKQRAPATGKLWTSDLERQRKTD